MLDFPACFESSAQYQEWRKCAQLAKEAISICTDCTGEYKSRMQEAGRCDPDKAGSVFFFKTKKSGK